MYAECNNAVIPPTMLSIYTEHIHHHLILTAVILQGDNKMEQAGVLDQLRTPSKMPLRTENTSV